MPDVGCWLGCCVLGWWAGGCETHCSYGGGESYSGGMVASSRYSGGAEGTFRDCISTLPKLNHFRLVSVKVLLEKIPLGKDLAFVWLMVGLLPFWLEYPYFSTCWTLRSLREKEKKKRTNLKSPPPPYGRGLIKVIPGWFLLENHLKGPGRAGSMLLSCHLVTQVAISMSWWDITPLE